MLHSNLSSTHTCLASLAPTTCPHNLPSLAKASLVAHFLSQPIKFFEDTKFPGPIKQDGKGGNKLFDMLTIKNRIFSMLK